MKVPQQQGPANASKAQAHSAPSQSRSLGREDTSTSEFQDLRPEAIAQRQLSDEIAATPLNDNDPLAQRKNDTGLPDNLKSGIENLSGYSMDDVKVHYNSSKPAQLNAHAYAQGTDIHVASGQEKHLPHEAWHVVQQKQGRVQPTVQMQGVAVNDDVGLETEADVMGEKAQFVPIIENGPELYSVSSGGIDTAQRKIGFEYEIGAIATQKNPTHENSEESWVPHSKGEILVSRGNYDVTADINGEGSQLEFVTKPLNENDEGDREKMGQIAKDIAIDLQHIAYFASENNGDVTLNQIGRLGGSEWQRMSTLQFNWKNLAGQLQMTGGVNIEALPALMSGASMPASDVDTPVGTDVQDLAIAYQQRVPGTDQLQQPVYVAALVEARKYEHLDGRAIDDEAAQIMASILALMAQIPMNARGLLNMSEQGKFLARTDYAKILQLLCQHSEILIDPASFTRSMVNVINVFSDDAIGGGDPVFPEDYSVGDITFTDVSIAQWTQQVLPSLGFLWGYWQGKDLMSKKKYPGNQQQKDELRPFGEFGSKTDPGNKIILEWRNLQSMYPDQLELAMNGLVVYLSNLNDT